MNHRVVGIVVLLLVTGCAHIANEPPMARESAAREYSPGSTFRDACEACPEMVVIPPGRFVMGSPASEDGRLDSEGPRRSVNMARALAVGKYEVTRGEYARFARETQRTSGGCVVRSAGNLLRDDPSASWQAPGYAQSDKHPVTCVNWDDARAYVAWLSRKSGANYRLLTEAEWEYAARAGTSTAFYWGGDAANHCPYANGKDRTYEKATGDTAGMAADCADHHAYSAPVGSLKPNAFGLHDMSGNVWEWTEDCWNASYNGAPGQGAAWVTGDCAQRVLRGGGWSDAPPVLRSAKRLGLPSGSRLYNFGFRVARTL